LVQILDAMHRRPRPRLRPGSTSGGDCYFGCSALTAQSWYIFSI